MPEPDELLAGRLDGSAGRVALIQHDRVFTRGELAGMVSRFAGGLQRELTRGDLLALWLPNGPELLALILACFRTGIVPMPLPPGLKWPELRQILSRALATGMAASATAVGQNAAELARLVGKLWLVPTGGVGATTLTGPAMVRTPPGADPDALELVLHTSGSSGPPKGVKLSHESIRHLLAYRLTCTGLGPDSVSVVASCLSQSVGLYQSLALLAARATIVLLDDYDLEPLATAVDRYRPTHLIMVVGAFDRLLHHPRITARSLADCSFAIAGADRLTPRVQERFRALTGRPLRASYGLTESSWALINDGHRSDKCLALGRLSPDVAIRLLDPHGHPVAPGEVGEIHIRSPRNLLGYLHDEESTRAVLAAGWLATGDLAYEDPEGDFWFAGRSKDLIVLASGDNVSPAEIEQALLSHPAVAGCVVTGSSAAGSEVPWAFVTRAREISGEALRDFLRERLSDYKVPARIEFVTELPVGLSGKIQRRTLGRRSA